MAASFENLIVERSGDTLLVTLNRPKVLNALNAALLDDLDQVIAEAGQDAEVGAVILTGAGDKAFVAGADIQELATLDAVQAKATARKGQLLLSRIERLGKPVIAAVNGFALGGGLELALACTFRTASSNAMVGLPEVKLGLIPGYGGTQRLPRLVGTGRAMELILSGEPISAEEAHRLGLVNHVFDPAELLPKTQEIVDKILARGPLAVRFAMESTYTGYDLSLDEGLTLEASLFGVLASTHDTKEGLTAFLEKRPASFQGK